MFSAGSRSEYSNTNYLLLSLIIEKVCNRPFQEVLTDRIISKINLKNTYFENAQDSTKKNSKSFKYFNSEWIQQPETVASNHLGAGAMVSTPSDLATFMDALFLNKLITSKSLEAMTSFTDEYGMGILKVSYDAGLVAFGHEGRIDEFYTSLIFYPGEKITIAYCTNGIMYPRDDIMKKVSELCLGKQTTIPDFDVLKEQSRSGNEFAGKYSSSFKPPIDVECKINHNEFIFSTQGQDFKTRQIDENYFVNLQFGFFFEFIPDKEQLILKEADNRYLLRKQK